MVWAIVFGMIVMPIMLTFVSLFEWSLHRNSPPPGYFLDLVASTIVLSLSIDTILGLSLFYPLRVWRTHIPLRFNRKTRKVYFYYKGHIFTTGWDTIRAYLDSALAPVGAGATTREPQVNIEFQWPNGSTLTVYLRAKKRFLAGSNNYQDAAAFWEYIRLYMEEGPDRLPEREGTVHETDLKTFLSENNPFTLFESETISGKVLELALFPLALVLAAVFYPTDYIYYKLAKRIKVNPFPPEIEEVCQCSKS